MTHKQSRSGTVAKRRIGRVVEIPRGQAGIVAAARHLDDVLEGAEIDAPGFLSDALNVLRAAVKAAR